MEKDTKQTINILLKLIIKELENNYFYSNNDHLISIKIQEIIKEINKD